ncbi:hypothetical protein IMSAG249_01940 [Lachnospiraceae bacterium]|nr:hypothetical protein IMSAG249_01940 [Lachnospiraceae bacterium]
MVMDSVEILEDVIEDELCRVAIRYYCCCPFFLT